MAGAQWVHTAEYRGEYDVPLQGAVRGTALGAEIRRTTHRSIGEMLGAQSDNALRHASDRARGMIESLRKVDYL